MDVNMMEGTAAASTRAGPLHGVCRSLGISISVVTFRASSAFLKTLCRNDFLYRKSS
jgi:hypothetical protein